MHRFPIMTDSILTDTTYGKFHILKNYICKSLIIQEKNFKLFDFFSSSNSSFNQRKGSDVD